MRRALDDEAAQDLVLRAGEDGDRQVLDLVGRVGRDLVRHLAADARHALEGAGAGR